MKVYFLLFLVGVLLVVSQCSKSSETNSEVEKAAVEVARDWLALIDGGQHAGSWEQSAAYFKGAISRENWEQTLAAARVPLGDPLSREVKSAKYMTSVPGAPDGEYVVVQFESRFENKAEAIETVTPMLDADGVWRVSGYFIK